ncbi:MAG: 23S rRNA pseudouridine(955/2504/2580) synthase, partial [Planctomycetes bacterium]|nr:23S rRNA pseudouridine(955/2504/2580) synthase [Planctomycetota bacterium]
GDEKYGDPAFNRQLRALGLRRMLLHAHLLEFTDPFNDEVITVSSPLDDDVKAVLARLESS